ncbi:S-layer homology domain-containing protein [Aminivibrio sp.]|jgi:hypothetical protein|uniref:S-layer homology domain-containing protein n=1 Tax=Aminivibrio sp. TaxID=1872489 RepID=UPI003D95D450
MKKILALVAVVALVAFAAPAIANVNPFMDVPMNHWAYDAIGQLASVGVLSGYPDGTYKGNQPTTRYEMASALARALAYVDMTKASKQDVEMLKKLVVEFKDELDALGVKVDKLDSRVAVLEDGVGGWKFWGEFRFDAKFAGEEQGAGGLYTTNGDTDFNLNRFRIWARKQVDDKATVTFRLGKDGTNNVRWERYFLTLQLPYDMVMNAGLYVTDWQADDKLYADNDAWFTDRDMEGFWFTKNFGAGMFQAFVAHFDPTVNRGTGFLDEGYEYGARFRWNFNENFWLSGNYIGWNYETVLDQHVWWAAFGARFNQDWELRGAFYNYDDGVDNNGAWQAILDVSQDALKFTSLWLEYVNISDAGFRTVTDGPWDNYGAAVTGRALGLYDNILFVKAEQKWSDKWRTFIRYLQGNARVAGMEDTTNYTFGVKYYYTPAVSFELAYDKVEGALTVPGRDDHLIRLRTHVVF